MEIIVAFDPSAESTTGRGWKMIWYTPGDPDTNVVETFYALHNPTGVANVSNKALTSNVATLTTSAAHGFVAGQRVIVAGVDTVFNGEYVVKTVPSNVTFTYDKTNADVASASASGTVTPVQSLVQRIVDLFSADDDIVDYFRTKAEAAYIAANLAAVEDDRDELLAAEGLTAP